MYSSSYVVIFDACVLFGFLHRDVLMQLATADLFRAKWTASIHDEWMRNVASSALMTRKQAERIRDLMDEHVLDCLVLDYEPLIRGVRGGLSPPDPDDRHVLAAAIRCGAQSIVTFNLADFPSSELQKCDIVAEHPDNFIVDLFDLDAAKTTQAFRAIPQAFRAIMERWNDPPFTEAMFVQLLRKRRFPRTAAALAKQFARAREPG